MKVTMSMLEAVPVAIVYSDRRLSATTLLIFLDLFYIHCPESIEAPVRWNRIHDLFFPVGSLEPPRSANLNVFSHHHLGKFYLCLKNRTTRYHLKRLPDLI